MIPGHDEVQALIKLLQDPQKGLARLADLQKATDTAKEAEAKAAEVAASLSQRIADLDRRESAVKDMELAAHLEQQRLSGIRDELVERTRQQREVGDQIKLRVLRYAGQLQGWNPELQSLPDWSVIDAMIAPPVDAHYSDDSVMTVIERVEHAQPGATIRRSRTMRREVQA